MRGSFSEIELPLSYNAHSSERADARIQLIGYEINLLNKEGMIIICIYIYVGSSGFSREMLTFMKISNDFSREVLKFMKINNDFNREVLKFMKISSDFNREVLKFMQIRNGFSREVLKFMKLSSQKHWVYDTS